MSNGRHRDGECGENGEKYFHDDFLVGVKGLVEGAAVGFAAGLGAGTGSAFFAAGALVVVAGFGGGDFFW